MSTLDLTVIGERTRRLRLVKGIGQAEFAQRVAIAAGSVSKIEHGQMALSADLLNAIARVLGCTSTALCAPPLAVPTTRPWLRAYADASKRAVDAQVADCTTAMEFVKTLGLKTIDEIIPVFQGNLSDDSEIDQFALDVRVAAGIGDNDVVGNSIRAAERLGCVVLPMREELGRHLGLSVRSDNLPMICVSRPSLDEERRVPGDRQRFTVAHEIGHLGLHAGLGPPQTATDAATVERQAHRFAGSFLLPADPLLDELATLGGRVTLRTLAQLKKRWGVSIKALVMRFRGLGVIDENQARSLYKQISSRGWNTSEPVEVGNESAIWLSKAIERRVGSASPTTAAAATASGIDASHIRRWTDWTPTGSAAAPADVIQLRTNRRPATRPEGTAPGTLIKLPSRES